MRKLSEQVVSRVEELTKVHRESFGKFHNRMVDDMFESMSSCNRELETLGLSMGIIICEQTGEHAVNKAVENLKSDPEFSDIDERDLQDLVKYFVDQNAGSIVFAPEVLSSFVHFCKEVGFPVTLGGAQKGGLEAPRYNTPTLLNVLVGAHVLTVSQVPGVDAKEAIHSSQEDQAFKESPKVKVDVYEFDQGFLKELSHVLRQMGIKEESICKKPFLQRLQEKKELDMVPIKKLEELENRLALLEKDDEVDLDSGEEEEEKPEVKGQDDASDEEEEGDDAANPVSSSEHEKSYFKQFDDTIVEKFVDGLLVVLGELEQTGNIEKIDSPEQARDAIVAAVRRLYNRRGLISKMSRKYSRFGSKRVLRKAKQDINKAIEQ